MRLIDADALKALVTQRHDFFRGCIDTPEKARRDELLQVMCDINEQPDVDAIPVEWIMKWSNKRYRETQRDVSIVDVLEAWQKEQEAR